MTVLEPLMSASGENPSQNLKRRRARGEGTVAPHREGFIARLPPAADPKRGSIGVFPTEEEAHRQLDATLVAFAAGDARALPNDGPTLASIGDGVIRARVAEGIGGAKDDKYRWKAVLKHEIADKPLVLLCEDDVVTWRNDLAKRRARSTVKNTLNLLRAVLEHARVKKMIGTNPAAGVKPPKKDPSVVHDAWTVLTPEEQRRVHDLDVEVAAAHLKPGVRRELAATRLMALFVTGSLVRPGEAWNLELPDLVVEGARPRVNIRFGSKGKLPKGRKVRKLPLFGLALEAARAWLKAMLPSYPLRNEHGLVFPTRCGARRTRLPKTWKQLLELAGVTRRVRFHDLRHTGASSLVSGSWGRAWSLEETQQMLGHASLQTTEIYAHFGDTVLDQAGRGTLGLKPPKDGGGEQGGAAGGSPSSTGSVGHRSVTGARAASHEPPGIPGAPRKIRTSDNWFRSSEGTEQGRVDTPTGDAVVTQLGNRALEVLRLIASGEHGAALERAEALACGVLDALPALHSARQYAGGAA